MRHTITLRTAVAATTLGLGLALSATSPAGAGVAEYTRHRVNDPSGDVQSNGGTPINRAEKQIDVIGAAVVRVFEKGGRDYVGTKVRLQNLRSTGKHHLFLQASSASGASFFAVADPRRGKVRYSSGMARAGGTALTTCRQSSVSANFKRDIARMTMAKSCLGGGDTVEVASFGSYFSPRLNPDYATAYDEVPSNRVLTYPH